MEIFTDFPNAIGVDVTPRCLLQCPKCLRTRQPELIKAGKDITIDEFTKICKYFKNVTLCGQISDSIYHPKFFDLLNVAKENSVRLGVSTNGSGKKQKFWDTIWNDYDPDTLHWNFALDGLPKDSHKYRINQKGEAVWEIMKQGAAAGHHITWQYIIFKYNENDIATAIKMAKEHGIKFNLLKSNRWNGPDGEEDIYKPTKETHLLPIDNPNELATDEEFFPRCVNKLKTLTYTNEGFVLPCCWTDRLKEYEYLKQDHLKVSNVEKIEDILMSDEWQTFYQNILEKNSNVSNMCRMKCRSGKKNKTAISFDSGTVDVYNG